MTSRLLTLLSALCIIVPSALLAETKPLKALLIAGGCCHDYAGQHKVLADGIQGLANVQVDVMWTDDKNPITDTVRDPRYLELVKKPTPRRHRRRLGRRSRR